jgi:Domain of unknown function (DUF4440)
MKRCHVCQRTYSDEINFCLQDGAPLVDEPEPSTGHTTFGAGEQPQSGPRYEPPPPPYAAGGAPGGGAPPPGGYGATPRPVAAAGKRKVWPWVLGGVVVVGLGLVVLAVLGALFFIGNRTRTTTNANVNVNISARRQTNSAAANRRDANGGDASTADKQAVMTELSKLENDWLRANIKADKKALERILADDYRGTMHDGTTQTKQEYLDTIRPDRTARSWASEGVTLDLEGDRATLSGVLIWNATNGTRRYRFVDTFERRDGRWQAVASVTSPAE